MNTIQIPQTDLTVSQVCMGTAQFGSGISQTDSFALLDAYVEHGGNFIDTARVYADWLPNGANASETTIGEWLKQNNKRDQIVLATKGAHPDLKTMHISRMSAEEIQHDIEASLRYLQTDVIDLYWLHRDDERVPVGEIVEILNSHIQAGRIRYIGCSNWKAARIRAANDYAQAHDLAGFVANQPMWSLAEPNRANFSDQTMVVMDDTDIQFHHEAGLAAIPFSSQAQGYFSKLAAGNLKEGDRSKYDNPVNLARFDRVQELSNRYSVSISSVVLSYLTSQPFPVIPIIGARTTDQLQDSLQDFGLALSSDEVDYLVGAEGR